MKDSIHAETMSVLRYMSSGRQAQFVIPEYQRPYAWEQEQVTTLFEDLWEFSNSILKSKDNNYAPYFLGSIVSYKTKETQEIIDGQQRLTSLFLLLRAIYSYLENLEVKTVAAEEQMRHIKSALWSTSLLDGSIDFEKPLITSRVISDDKNNVFIEILKTGYANPEDKDNNYSKNYIKFQELFEEKSRSSGINIYNFILNILTNVVLLPIEANSSETALTIFATLNNRGMPLSDADIFKANIYKGIENPGEKQDFINEWQLLDERSSFVDEKIQNLFYYLMFYIRAKEGDKNNTTPGLRKFFSEDNKKKYMVPDTLKKLTNILNFWNVVKGKPQIDKEDWSRNIEIKQVLDILLDYPNEFWKYPVFTYYLSHRTENKFEKNFLIFLRKLAANLLVMYIEKPYITAVKSNILNLNAESLKNSRPNFSFPLPEFNSLNEKIKNPPVRSVRMLLKILAYNNKNQKELLTSGWQIEHILPKKYDIAYFDDTPERINKSIEELGNKLPLESKLNIQAKNNYFNDKKKKYINSSFYITKDFANKNLAKNDWKCDDISERNNEVREIIKHILKKWIDSQWDVDEIIPEGLSSEEWMAVLAMRKK